MAKLKVFVWENCFYDYSAGLAVVIAENSEQARDVLEGKIGYRHGDLAERPQVYDLNKCKSVAFFVHGGS